MPNIVGHKDAAGSPGETARLLEMVPDGYEVYSGDDSLTLPLMAIGAVGVIGVATHWAGREMRTMFDAYCRPALLKRCQGPRAVMGATCTPSGRR